MDHRLEHSPLADPQHAKAPAFRVYFDGECPLCRREIEFLRRRDRRGGLDLVDIASPEFASLPGVPSRETLMARIHGQLPDGTLVEGVEVFRRAYAAVGLGWLLAPTAWPGIRLIVDAAYRWFARNRLRLTGRPDCGDRCSLPQESSP